MDKSRKSALLHFLRQNLIGIILGVARVNDDGQTGFAGDIDMHAKKALLNLALGIIVVIIKPAFADPDNARILARGKKRGAPQIGVLVGLVRVNSNACEDVFLAVRCSDNLLPFALLGEMLRKAPTPALRARFNTPA